MSSFWKRRFFYREPIIPVLDYLFTLSLDVFIYDIAMPFFVSVLIYFLVLSKISLCSISSFSTVIIGILAILIGFSITSLTIIVSNGNQNIEKLKNTQSSRKLNGKNISLYQLLIITNTYSIVAEIVALLINLSFLFIFKSKIYSISYSIYYSLNIFMLLHIFFLILRNATNIYLVFYKNNTKSNFHS